MTHCIMSVPRLTMGEDEDDYGNRYNDNLYFEKKTSFVDALKTRCRKDI